MIYHLLGFLLKLPVRCKIVPGCRQTARHGAVEVYCGRRRLRVGNFAAETSRGSIPLSFCYRYVTFI